MITIRCRVLLLCLAFTPQAASAQVPLDQVPLDQVPLDQVPLDQRREPVSVYPSRPATRITDVNSPATVKGNFPRLLVSDKSADVPRKSTKQNKFAAPLVTVTSSLAVVLGLFAVLVWVSRKYGSKSLGGSIPSEVIQTLGSTAIDPRTRITLIRLSKRILVLSQSASGIQTISEITDPDEVRDVTALCVGDSKAQFSSVLQSIHREPVQAGFVDQSSDPVAAAPTPRQRGSLFTTA